MTYQFKLKEAKKESIPPLIGLWGKSGSGKTYSALLLARGLVGPSGKIAVIDTENRRAEFYSHVGAPWYHLDLQPPFEPEKYTAAFKFCEQQGANVIIVDSISHVWEGAGGVLDQADNAKTKNGGEMYGLARWKGPKMAYKMMMNNLIRSPIPVIFCVRAKDAVKQIGRGKDMEIIPLGPQPIVERNFVFEMTVDLHMTKDGSYDLETSKTVPEALRDAIRPGGVVNEEMGRQVALWAGSGIAADQEYIKLKRDGTDSAAGGVESYKAFLAGLDEKQKAKIKSHHSAWSKDAKLADAEREKDAQSLGGIAVDTEEMPI